jgi:hypothetical protein
MTDKELLELAAKAAGIELMPMQINNVTKQGDDRFIGYMTKADEWPRGWFDPLTDDGDALRLAVKLKICIGPNFDNDCAVADGGDFSEHHAVEMHNNDPYAATRRAITRAAAEIGKSML